MQGEARLVRAEGWEAGSWADAWPGPLAASDPRSAQGAQHSLQVAGLAPPASIAPGSEGAPRVDCTLSQLPSAAKQARGCQLAWRLSLRRASI